VQFAWFDYRGRLLLMRDGFAEMYDSPDALISRVATRCVDLRHIDHPEKATTDQTVGPFWRRLEV